MKIGDLVRIRGHWQSDHLLFGVVENYRQDHNGGSGTQSWKKDNKWHQEIINSFVRGDVLVMCYSDGSTSWYDENDVEPVQDDQKDGKITT